MKFLFLIYFILFYSVPLFSNDPKGDSLMELYLRAETPKERTDGCLNLDNYYRNVLLIDSIPFTRMLLEEGIKANNEYIISDALRKLVMGVNRKERVLTNDSIIHYLKIADKVLTGERRRSFITEVRLRHIRSTADWVMDESRIIEELTTKYANPVNNEKSIYFEIEKNYALGMAAALSISENSVDGYANTLRYFDKLFELIQNIPIEYGAEVLFWVNENIYLSYINSKNSEKAVVFLENMMNILKKYKELPNVKSDVYQDFAFVNSLYNEGIAYFPSIVGYDKAFACLKKTDHILRKREDLISLYFAYKGFYEDLNEHKKVILYCDSIAAFMKTYDSPVVDAVISGMYKDQAMCYAALNKYKQAFEFMQAHDVLQNKITDGESKKLRADMEARYDLDHLELEKEQLTSRNRRIAFFSSFSFFLLSVAWGISQRYHLNKLKKMQKELIESNKEVLIQSEKAKESEKMKSAFINSMCHEIRTPLNAINGFSDLLLDESIDMQDKEPFPALICKNANLLTRLLNDLLEVSNLSSSAEELLREPTDIIGICQQEMENLKFSDGKEFINYRLDLADECRYINTNSLYLSQVISHLLNNSNKFTERGEIALICRLNINGKFELRVTDTGIGIPIDKQEWVFDRFAKINSFEQGAGLGLYVCRLIIGRLGGDICIDSDYTNGTSFVITLPN